MKAWQYRDLSFEQRFARWDVDEKSGCWIWRGCTNSDGYGSIIFEGRTMGVHRVSYILHVGSIPEGKELDHLCRNRRCLNPDHLELVTHRENVLRGEAAEFSTHCSRGHLFDGWDAKQGRQYCKICKQIIARKNYVPHPRQKGLYCKRGHLYDGWDEKYQRQYCLTCKKITANARR